jgi:hypothetical protein
MPASPEELGTLHQQEETSNREEEEWRTKSEGAPADSSAIVNRPARPVPRWQRPAAAPTREIPRRTQRPREEWQNAPAALNANVSVPDVIAYHTAVIPSTYNQAMLSDEAEEWTKACATEMGSMQSNGVWELVDLPEGRRAIESKWVFDLKRNEKGEVIRHKARLVAKGFRQAAGVNYFETFASVVKFTSVRVTLTLAAVYDYEIIQIDAVTAFLNGQLMTKRSLHDCTRRIYRSPGSSKVCRLVKAIYGLKQAGRQWLAKLRSVLRSLGTHRCKLTTACTFGTTAMILLSC